MRHHYYRTPAIVQQRRMLPVTATVQAVANAVDTSRATAADLQTLAEILRDAVREGVSAGLAAQRVDERTPMFGALGQFLRANEGLIALVALIVAVLTFLQDRAANEKPDPPPSVTVLVKPPDRAEVERIVEERLDELEAQDDAS
jgi:hypothetical protein